MSTLLLGSAVRPARTAMCSRGGGWGVGVERPFKATGRGRGIFARYDIDIAPSPMRSGDPT